MFPRENEFDAAIIANAQRYDVPVWVIKATIGKESSFNPKAFRAELAIHDASRGLMQILETTARALGLRGSVGDDATKTGGLYEPELNIQLGTKLISQLQKRYPSEAPDAIYAAFNAGSIQRNAADDPNPGELENEANVIGWRRIADYFNPGWRGDPAGPFQPAPA